MSLTDRINSLQKRLRIHSNDEDVKQLEFNINIWEQSVCSHWPSAQWKHLFPFPLPLHSWMTLIQDYFHTEFWPNPHTGTFWRVKYISSVCFTVFHFIRQRPCALLTCCLVSFAENQTSKQTNKTSGKFVYLYVLHTNYWPSLCSCRIKCIKVSEEQIIITIVRYYLYYYFVLFLFLEISKTLPKVIDQTPCYRKQHLADCNQ